LRGYLGIRFDDFHKRFVADFALQFLLILYDLRIGVSLLALFASTGTSSAAKCLARWTTPGLSQSAP